MAAKLPASALSLADDGQVGVKTVSPKGQVMFTPVRMIEEEARHVWLAGIPEEALVVVTGHAYVSAGQVIALEEFTLNRIEPTSQTHEENVSSHETAISETP